MNANSLRIVGNILNNISKISCHILIGKCNTFKTKITYLRPPLTKDKIQYN